jgi:hypothetical protein
MNEQHERFLKQIAAFQCDGLNEAERIEFEAALLNDEQCRQLFIETQERSMAIADCFQRAAFSTSIQTDPPLAADSSLPIANAPTVTLKPKASTNTAFRMLLVAGVTAAAVVSYFIVHREPKSAPALNNDVSVEFAKLTYSEGAVWEHADSTEVSLGGYLQRDRAYCLTAGLARLEMAGGGTVTFAAPSCFRGIGPGEIELLSGKIAARLPSLESDLSVRIGRSTVRDQGRAFGVTAQPDGSFDVSVFDGSVAVQREGLDGIDHEQQVTEGKSLTTISDHSKDTDVPFNAAQYQDIWPLTIGINDASSIVEFTLPGPQQPLTELANSKKLLLIPEQHHKRIQRAINLRAVHPGKDWPGNEPTTLSFKPGQVVSSYLLVYVPSSTEALPSHSISGSITFERRILGAVIQDVPLKQSDKVFGIKDIDYDSLTWRRLEATQTGEGNVPADSLHISPDGKQLYFNLHVSTGQDSIRVLIDESRP